MQAAYGLRQKGGAGNDLYLIPHRAGLHAEGWHAIRGEDPADRRMNNCCLRAFHEQAMRDDCHNLARARAPGCFRRPKQCCS